MTSINITNQETVYSWSYTSVISAQINDIKDYFRKTLGMITGLAEEVKANQSESETLWEVQSIANTKQAEEIRKIYEFALSLQQKLDTQERKLSELKQLQEKTEDELKKSIEEVDLQKKQIQDMQYLQDTIHPSGAASGKDERFWELLALSRARKEARLFNLNSNGTPVQ